MPPLVNPVSNSRRARAGSRRDERLRSQRFPHVIEQNDQRRPTTVQLSVVPNPGLEIVNPRSADERCTLLDECCNKSCRPMWYAINAESIYCRRNRKIGKLTGPRTNFKGLGHTTSAGNRNVAIGIEFEPRNGRIAHMGRAGIVDDTEGLIPRKPRSLVQRCPQ